MKTAWVILLVGLFCNIPMACAEPVQLDLDIPDVHVNGVQGDTTVALRVEDDRPDISIGFDSDGDDLILGRNMALEMMDSFSLPLRLAGFSLEPYRPDAPLALVVRIKSLTWMSENHLVISKVHLASSLTATVVRNGRSTYVQKIGTTGDYTVPWRPDIGKIDELVSGTLADDVRAVMQNRAVMSALESTPRQSR